MSRQNNASVTFILVTVLLDTLGLGVIIPVLPSLVASFLGDDLSAASGYLGAFLATYSAMQFLFALVLGGLSDRFGRRPVLLGSLLGAALDYLLLAVAPSLGWLFVGRLLSGITGASFSAAHAYIADVTPPEKRAQSFGLVGAAFGLGFIIGPAVGGLLGSVHPRFPFFVAAGLNFINFLYGFFVLPESLRPENRRAFTLSRVSPLSSLKNLGRRPAVLGVTGTLISSMMAQQILQSVWALSSEQRFGWTELDVGLSLTLVGVAQAVVQGGLIRVVIPWLGERRALFVGLAINIVAYVAFGVVTRGWMLYALLAPFSLGGIVGPAAQAILSREVDPSEQGEMQGSISSLQSLTAIAGPILGTQLLARFAPEGARFHIPGAPYFAAACFNAYGLLLALRFFARTPTKPAA
jgi:MFS transporter, DHA1 family, tetracycline resistance protein